MAQSDHFHVDDMALASMVDMGIAIQDARLALQTNRTTDAAINWLTERQQNHRAIGSAIVAGRSPQPAASVQTMHPLPHEEPEFSPQTVSVEILSNTIQLCHF